MLSYNSEVFTKRKDSTNRHKNEAKVVKFNQNGDLFGITLNKDDNFNVKNKLEILTTETFYKN